MRHRSFESEAARFFGSKILRELLHSKNVVEASVLCSDRGTHAIYGGYVNLETG
jgi:hypothetical protein